jgi:hypothetical protein
VSYALNLGPRLRASLRFLAVCHDRGQVSSPRVGRQVGEICLPKLLKPWICQRGIALAPCHLCGPQMTNKCSTLLALQPKNGGKLRFCHKQYLHLCEQGSSQMGQVRSKLVRQKFGAEFEACSSDVRQHCSCRPLMRSSLRTSCPATQEPISNARGP